MKNRISAALLALALLFGCTGCALFETEYTYAEPYTETLERDTGNATEIRNYSMLKAAILDMINDRKTAGELRFSNYNGVVSDDLAAVCLEIKSSNPMGAYAVDTLTYDSSRIVSYYVAEIRITYKKSLEEIRSIRGVASETELEGILREALSSSQERVAVRTYLPSVDEGAIAALLEKICFSDPVNIVIPVVPEISAYPGEGSNRIFEIVPDYREIPMQRAMMSAALRSGVGELLSGELPAAPEGKALEIARRLDAGLTGQPGRYGGTAYGAICEHGADSLGIALAYAALCREAEIECIVVRGSIGAMGTEEHYWNILRIGDDYYHADISQFPFGEQYAFLMDDDAIWGTYIWDTEAYPACRGPLRYADAAPDIPEEEHGEEETGAQTPETEETPAPEETEPPVPTESDAPEDAEEAPKN